MQGFLKWTFIILFLFGTTTCTKQSDFPNPPTEIKETSLDAFLAADAKAKEVGGKVYESSDTGSMKPTIGDHWYLVCKRVPYDSLERYDIMSYKPKWNLGKLTCHRYVLKDKYGIIAAGDHNKHAEPEERVTDANYDSKVLFIYGFK